MWQRGMLRRCPWRGRWELSTVLMVDCTDATSEFRRPKLKAMAEEGEEGRKRRGRQGAQGREGQGGYRGRHGRVRLSVGGPARRAVPVISDGQAHEESGGARTALGPQALLPTMRERGEVA